MPFKSEAQRKWMHAKHPEMARRWEDHTPNKRLPEHVKGSAMKGLKRASDRKRR